MAKKVKYARLQLGTFLPNFGELPQALPPNNRSWPYIMTWDSEGLHLADEKGGDFEALIPFTHCQLVIFEGALPNTPLVLKKRA